MSLVDKDKRLELYQTIMAHKSNVINACEAIDLIESILYPAFKSSPDESVNDVIRRACLIYKIHPSDVLSKVKRRPLIDCRFLIWHYLSKKHRLSPAEIAKVFTHDRTTVYHGIKKMDDLLVTDKDVRRCYHMLDRSIG